MCPYVSLCVRTRPLVAVGLPSRYGSLCVPMCLYVPPGCGGAAVALWVAVGSQEAVQLDGEVFGALLRRVAPSAHRHLRRHRVEPALYLTEWFMCIFARSLPWAAVLRVWDMFFCEGVKVMFRVGLVLLRLALGSPEKLRSAQGMFETMELLRSVPPPGLHEDALVHQVVSVPVSEAQIERERSAQRRRWAESRGEMMRPPRPNRGPHGARGVRMHRGEPMNGGGGL
eukprot:XP_025001272.1 TBC1 domain family member 10B-like [Gallus gallus]